MITDVKRAGGQRWLAALLVSCLLLVLAAGARLVLAADGADGGQLTLGANELAQTPDPSARPSVASPADHQIAASRDQQRTAPKAAKRGEAHGRSDAKQPGRPKTLSIARLGVRMPITAVTLDRTGAMEIPSRPSEIGWYSYGPRPGSARGSAVLGGHVDSREHGVGPLVSLQRLRRGDEIVIGTDTGAEHFRVSTVRLISKPDLDVSDVFNRDGEAQLRILTCGGQFRRSQGEYQQNVVVTAQPR